MEKEFIKTAVKQKIFAEESRFLFNTPILKKRSGESDLFLLSADLPSHGLDAKQDPGYIIIY